MTSLSAFITKHAADIFVLMLLLMILSRFSITYGTSDRIVKIPELQFASQILGRDFKDYTVLPAYQIRNGKSPFTFGYASPLVALGSISLLESTGICRLNQPNTCTTITYHCMLMLSFTLYVFLLFTCITDDKKRLIAFLIFATFLVGVPMNKAIEAGNIDILLSPVIGLCFVWIRQMREGKTAPVTKLIVLGLILGILLNMKAFIVPFVAVLLLFALPLGWYTVIGCVVGFIGSALWPRIWGIPAGLFDVVSFAMRSTRDFGPQLYTQTNYGNNAIIGYTSNILRAFDVHRVNLPTHKIITDVLSFITASFLFYMPFRLEHMNPFAAVKSPQKYTLIRIPPVSIHLIHVLLALSYVSILTLTTWSYDYRIVYGLPVIFLLYNETRDAKTHALLVLSIVFLLFKSLWIPKDRIMTIFLYLHMFFLLLASASLIKKSRPTGRRRKITTVQL